MPGVAGAHNLLYRDARMRDMVPVEDEESFAICVQCGHPIEMCDCVCPYCGERDKCECALFDAATGG